MSSTKTATANANQVPFPPVPRLIDAIDPVKYMTRIMTEVPAYSTADSRYEIVYSLPNETAGNFVRAFQEPALMNTRVKCRQRDGKLRTLPSFAEIWSQPGSRLPFALCEADDPHEAKWQLQRKFGYKLATTFMPGYAKSIFEYFGGRRVLDPCAGWGDRMVAAAASKCVESYTGFDPNRALRRGYAQMMEVFGHAETGSGNGASLGSSSGTGQESPDADLTFSNGFRVVSAPFETGALDLADASFDFAFTSPPFFDYEVYSSANPTYTDWIAEFYTPLFVQTARLLVPGAFFAVYLEDTSAGEIHRFLYGEVDEICALKYVSKIGFKGVFSDKTREIFIFQSRGGV